MRYDIRKEKLAIMPCPKHEGKHPLHDNRHIVKEDGSIVCTMTDTDHQQELAKLFSASPKLFAACDKADTAFAVININSESPLNPQGRTSLAEAWTAVTAAMEAAREWACIFKERDPSLEEDEDDLVQIHRELAITGARYKKALEKAVKATSEIHAKLERKLGRKSLDWMRNSYASFNGGEAAERFNREIYSKKALETIDKAKLEEWKWSKLMDMANYPENPEPSKENLALFSDEIRNAMVAEG